MLTAEERKEKVVDNIDPDFFVEVLNISTEQLVEAFGDLMEDKWDTFAYLEEEANDYDPESISS